MMQNVETAIEGDSYSELGNTTTSTASAQITEFGASDSITVKSANCGVVEEPANVASLMLSVSAVETLSAATESNAITSASSSTETASATMGITSTCFYGKTRSSGDLWEPCAKRAKRVPSCYQ